MQFSKHIDDENNQGAHKSNSNDSENNNDKDEVDIPSLNEDDQDDKIQEIIMPQQKITGQKRTFSKIEM